MTDAPEWIKTRHYANGIINARRYDDDWFLNGNDLPEYQWVREDIHADELARLRAENRVLRLALTAYAGGVGAMGIEWEPLMDNGGLARAALHHRDDAQEITDV